MNEDTPAQAMGQGVSLITLPLPFRAPPSVNAYVIEGGEGLTLIDCGTDWPDGFETLTAGLTALGMNPGGIHTLVVTHLHPDHVGMAPRSGTHLGDKDGDALEGGQAGRSLQRHRWLCATHEGTGRPPRCSPGPARGFRGRRVSDRIGCR